MPTVARILELTPASCYLAANATAKGGLFGPPVDPRLPQTIYMVYKVLKKVYDADPNYTGVQEVADYLYELIIKYAFKAAAIIDNNSGGQIVPPSGVTIPNPYDFEVSDSSFIKTGETSVIITEFIGYNVNFSRNGVMQNTTSLGDGSTYYSWNIVTGEFAISSPAGQGELFRIMPDAYGVGGSSTIIDDTTFPFIVTSANFESDGVTLNDPRLVGKTVTLFVNNFSGNLLIQGTDFTPTATGIVITAPGFDANNFNYTIQVNKIN
jgi:hypothetical protein